MIKLINNKVAVGRFATFFYPSQSLQCNPNLFVGESLTFCLLHLLCLLAKDITFAAMQNY